MAVDPAVAAVRVARCAVAAWVECGQDRMIEWAAAEWVAAVAVASVEWAADVGATEVAVVDTGTAVVSKVSQS